ncbi:glycosyltransferase family 4 protein [Aneurinibacillus migulanus]|uniref:glycosyltransferase family 4 protein n=1 Tax=Aneurinibacillus migulanus TaxID=47500 RepID=UPI002E1F1891|nr:glycosyltransferase family 4 protein [Aneurinibacillus migulanus]
MNISYIITRSDWGGAQAHLYDLIEYIKHNTEYNCHLIIGEEGRLSEQVQVLGVPVDIIPTLIQPINPWKDLRAISDVLRILKRVKPSLVHTHSSKAGMVGRSAARIAGIPSVFTAHGWAFTEGVSTFRKNIAVPLERWMGRYSDSIICVSEYDRKLALDYRIASSEKIVAIHNGIPDVERAFIKEHQTLETQQATEDRALKCIMVARFSVQKDQETLLRAISKLSLGTPIELYFVGQGELIDSMRLLAKELNVIQKVHFLGPRVDIPQLLATMDVFLLITNYEGFPISILEAMRTGLPVIASNVGGVREAITDGVNGYLVSRGDSEAIKERLELLARDSNLQKVMGKAGREKFLKYFTSKKMFEKTLSVYNKVLQQRGG